MKTHSPTELSLAVRRGGVVRVQRVAIAEPLCNLQLAEAKSATLKIGGDSICVRGIVRHADGTFTGRVYGLQAASGDTHSALANGDTISFEEAHVFSYGD